MYVYEFVDMPLSFVLNLSVLLSFAFSIQLQHDFHFTMLNERVESNRSIVLCKLYDYICKKHMYSLYIQCTSCFCGKSFTPLNLHIFDHPC